MNEIEETEIRRVIQTANRKFLDYLEEDMDVETNPFIKTREDFLLNGIKGYVDKCCCK